MHAHAWICVNSERSSEWACECVQMCVHLCLCTHVCMQGGEREGVGEQSRKAATEKALLPSRAGRPEAPGRRSCCARGWLILRTRHTGCTVTCWCRPPDHAGHRCLPVPAVSPLPPHLQQPGPLGQHAPPPGPQRAFSQYGLASPHPGTRGFPACFFRLGDVSCFSSVQPKNLPDLHLSKCRGLWGQA